MATRYVTHVTKNPDGTIKALGHPGEDWSPREKEDVIRDIEKKLHTYRVKTDVEISVVHFGKYVRTDPDSSVKDNLLYLPDLPTPTGPAPSPGG